MRVIHQQQNKIADLEKELEYYFGLTQAQITEIDELKQQIKDQRHQVCEEIKEFLYSNDLIKDTRTCAGKYVFEKFLDQIEKGE